MGTPRIQWPIEQMKEWYEAGESLKDIGVRLGRDFRLVHRALRKHGVAMRSRGCRSYGADNPAWKGGRRVDKQGYLLTWVPEHPFANNAGCVREHRLVAERVLGRYLTRDEVVHHIDDDPANNDPANLIVYPTNGHHLADTLAGKCPKWTPEGVQKMKKAVSRKRGPQHRSSQNVQTRNGSPSRKNKNRPKGPLGTKLADLLQTEQEPAQ